MPSLTLALTIGDPLGIGPEITARFLSRHAPGFTDQQFRIYGDLDALAQAARQMQTPLPASGNIAYLDTSADLPGKTAYLAIERAVADIVSGEAHALVTGPISKQHLHEAGILASGHTEILELLARTHDPQTKAKAEMLFVCKNFRMLLLTRHIPLSRVPSALMGQDNRAILQTLRRFLKTDAGMAHPRIALLGVNPHAGEIGGTEERTLFGPLLADLNAEGDATWEGPFPADALFRGFDVEHVPYDAYVAAYHDQGLIPFKLIAGYRAVNVTIGLPFIRTSVSHGTAMDIAGKGIATEESLVEAVRMASNLVSRSQSTLPCV